MKKIFTVLAIFALVFAACDDVNGNKDENDDVIGTWIDRWGEATMEIGNKTFTIVLGYYNFTGSWTRQGSILSFKGNNFTATATLTEGHLMLHTSFDDYDDWWNLIKKGSGASFEADTVLTIRNESSSWLYDTKWIGQEFLNTRLQPSFTTTLYVEGQEVFNPENSGYLYFSVAMPDITGSHLKNPIACRTQESITVSKGESKIFTVTNNTLVIDLSDMTNTPKRLQDIASTLLVP